MSLPDPTNTSHAFPPHPKTAFAHAADHEPEPDADHPLVRAANLTPRQRNAVLGAQVRFFIEASESVETDEETIRDILSALGEIVEDVELDDADADGDLGEPSGAVAYAEEGDEEDKDEEEVEINTNFRDEDVRIGAGWGKQEVRRMLYHLKHHGMSSFVKEYVSTRAIPIPELLCAFGLLLADELQTKKPNTLLYFLRVALYRELQLREKLPQYNTIDDAVNLIATSRRILILTGAGISVSCGIPDFRSRNGLYATLKDSGEYDLDDPQQMFDIEYFREHPNVFYSFAKNIYPSNFIPSPCHRFIKLVEDQGKLLRNYTQNIDTLETLAGVRTVLQCHGSFATASCVQCRTRVAGKEIEAEILRGEIPLCKICNAAKKSKPRRKSRGKRRNNDDDDDEEDEPPFPPGIMKPDITFFGEKLTDDFDYALAEDRQSVDLILVIGTSLKVSPVSDILTHMPHSVPQILINKTPVKHINPDIVLLGNADAIVEYLCAQLGWELPPHTPPSAGLQPPAYPVRKKRRSQEPASFTPQRVGNSHVWLFEGADGGKWVEDLETEQAAAALAALHVPSLSSSQSSLTSQSSSKSESRGKKKARVS
ncbi:SIR2-domain-containing protein [Dentipellis sp. KUC8613]|nr:SIR2-domain-containing protein [Dentipellis sp. KUC8613]